MSGQSGVGWSARPVHPETLDTADHFIVGRGYLAKKRADTGRVLSAGKAEGDVTELETCMGLLPRGEGFAQFGGPE